MTTQSQIHLGKNGITENFISTLKDHFKNYENVKVSILKGAGHDRKKAKEYSQQIVKKLGRNYTGKVVGFTIFLKKWRRPVR